MSNFSYTVEATAGGIGSDAWTARACMTDGGLTLSMKARGETPAAAKRALENKIAELARGLDEMRKALTE